MSKKDAKITNAAHIKRHTVGTSNELSFSVLDAAKNRADAEEGKEGKVPVPKFGKIPLFSLPKRLKKPKGTPTKENSLPLAEEIFISGQKSAGRSDSFGSINVFGGSSRTGVPSLSSGLGSGVVAPSFSYTSSEDEIVRRKTRRRRRRASMLAIGFVLAIAFLMGGGVYLYSEVTKHEAQVSLLDQSLSKIAETDAPMLSMDQAITKPHENLSSDLINALIEKIPEAHQQLADAKILVEQANADMRESTDKEAAGRALATIESREEMLTLGQQLLEAGVRKEKDIEALNTAWALVLQADALAREAAILVTDTTSENVNASKEKSIQAQQIFDEARYQLEMLAESPVAFDMQALVDYAVKRSESMGYAISSDDAILAQDRLTAQSQNDAYNVAENEAATMAKDLPSEKAQVIILAYEEAGKNARDRYAQVRAKLSTADAFLRDYLGT